MTCDNCGQEGAYIRRTPLAYGLGENLVVIENVPMISCRNCGVDLLSAETVHQLHQLRSQPANIPLHLVHVTIFQDKEDSAKTELAMAAA